MAEPFLVTEPFLVEGLERLVNAFAVSNQKLGKELTAGLKRAAEPVRVSAESLAVGRIRTVGFKWSQMRVGVTPGSVYVAPRARGVRLHAQRRRPKFATLLRDRAMDPALHNNIGTVERIVGETLNKVSSGWASG